MKRRGRIPVGKEIRMQLKRDLLTGMDTKDITEKHGFGIKNLKFHITKILEEEGVKNRIQLMAKYVKMPDELNSIFYIDDRITTLTGQEQSKARETNLNILPIGRGSL